VFLQATILLEGKENHRERAVSDQGQLPVSGDGRVSLRAQLRGRSYEIDVVHRYGQPISRMCTEAIVGCHGSEGK
jgi:hypothetical protein